MHIRKYMSTSELDDLSTLKGLLKRALMAHYRTPLDIAGQSPDPGCFGLKTSMAEIVERRVRGSRRAAAGRSIARLMKRGLLESCSRGTWRLTRLGFKAAREFYPEIKPLSKRQVAATIALRKTLHSALGAQRRRPSAKAPQAPERISDTGEAGIEIDLDF
jgi:restriction endonuclease Mrr